MHMTTAPHLLNEDRPDFEHVLDEALRIVLDEDGARGPGVPDSAALPLNAEQLRTLALAAAEQISAQAAEEYDAYRTIRADTREAVRELSQLDVPVEAAHLILDFVG